jgi:hypothetical protein
MWNGKLIKLLGGLVMFFSIFWANSLFGWDIYVSGYLNGDIYKIDSESGRLEVIASGFYYHEDMAIDDNKEVLYIASAAGGWGIKRIDLTTKVILTDVGINICGPEGPTVDSNGDLYVNTRRYPCSHSGVWKIEKGEGIIAKQVIPSFSRFGEGTAFLNAGPFKGYLMAVDSIGYRVVISSPEDLNANRRPATFFGTSGIPISLAVNRDGDIYVSYYYLGKIDVFDYNGKFKYTFISGLINPLYIDFDPTGNLYVVEYHPSNRVLKITPDGTKKILASISGAGLTGIAISHVLTVQIDIKPGSFPNSINLKSKGKVPVAVLTTDTFDASTIDCTTVTLAGALSVKSNLEDVDGDGDLDLVFHFSTQDLDLTSSSTEATLRGFTFDGATIKGSDSIRIVSKGDEK